MGIAAAHLDVVSGADLGGLGGVVPPVGSEHSLKPPFVTENAGDELFVFRGSDSVDDIVGGHDHPGISLPDSNLKSLEVNFPKSPLGKAGVGFEAVGLLVVAGKVLGAGADLAGLDASDESCSHFAGKKGIFRVVFEISAAERTSMNIHGGSQPDCNVVFLYFHAACPADFFEEFLVPCAGQEGGTGEGSSGDADTGLNAETCGAVRGHDRRDAVLGKISHSEGIGDAGVGLSAEKADPVFKRQLGKKVIKFSASVRRLPKRDWVL